MYSDEISYCSPSEELGDTVSHRDKLQHLLEHSTPKIGFVILICVFPQNPTHIKKGKNKGKEKLPWEQNYHLVSFWEKQWRKLTDDLNQKGTDAKLVSIGENHIEIYPYVKCPKCGNQKVHDMGVCDSIDAERNYFCSKCGYIWRIKEDVEE